MTDNAIQAAAIREWLRIEHRLSDVDSTRSAIRNVLAWIRGAMHLAQAGRDWLMVQSETRYHCAKWAQELLIDDAETRGRQSTKADR